MSLVEDARAMAVSGVVNHDALPRIIAALEAAERLMAKTPRADGLTTYDDDGNATTCHGCWQTTGGYGDRMYAPIVHLSDCCVQALRSLFLVDPAPADDDAPDGG